MEIKFNKDEYFEHPSIKKAFTSGDFVTNLCFVNEADEYKGNRHFKVCGLVEESETWISELNNLIEELMPIAKEHYEKVLSNKLTGKALADFRKSGLQTYSSLQKYFEEDGTETSLYKFTAKIPEFKKTKTGLKSNKPIVVNSKAKRINPAEIEVPAEVAVSYRLSFIPVGLTLYATLRLLGVQYLGRPETCDVSFVSRDGYDDDDDGTGFTEREGTEVTSDEEIDF